MSAMLSNEEFKKVPPTFKRLKKTIQQLCNRIALFPTLNVV